MSLYDCKLDLGKINYEEMVTHCPYNYFHEKIRLLIHIDFPRTGIDDEGSFWSISEILRYDRLGYNY